MATTSSSDAVWERKRKVWSEKGEVIYLWAALPSVSRPSMRLIYIPAHNLPAHKHALGDASLQIWTSSLMSLRQPWTNSGKKCVFSNRLASKREGNHACALKHTCRRFQGLLMNLRTFLCSARHHLEPSDTFLSSRQLHKIIQDIKKSDGSLLDKLRRSVQPSLRH